MARSKNISLERVLEDWPEEDEYVAASAALVEEIYDKSMEWKSLVREEESEDKVRDKAQELAVAANTLEQLQRGYRSPHPTKHGMDRRENFDGIDSELLIKSNKAISYVNDLGTADFYEFQEPEEIGEGEFCVLNGYVTPGEILDEMPDTYTEDMIRLDFSKEVDNLPRFGDYRSLPEL